MVSLTKNFFEIFQLPVSCRIDLSLLLERYHELQKNVHPDRFSGVINSQQQLIVQFSAYVNDGFNTLRSPLKRFLYLFQLAGRPIDLENNIIMDTVFLVEQMELRETVRKIKNHQDPSSELDCLITQVNNEITAYQRRFETLWEKGDSNSLDEAVDIVQKMQFIVKLTAELKQKQLEYDLLD